MRKRIALVDWNWVGHHPTFFNYFILAMEELGMEVLALCPNPDEAEALARQTRRSTGDNAPQSGRTHFEKIRITEQRFPHLRPRRLAAIDWAIRHFRGIENQALAWTPLSGGRVDAIFHACVYDRDFEWMQGARPFLRIPWTGLYLHALSYRMPGAFRPGTRRKPFPERIFGGQLCRSLGILDEGIVSEVSRHLGKPVVALPDLADGRPAETGDECLLGGCLKDFAAGRPIVGLFGHLQKSKGLLTFLEAARLPGASGVCFALAGDVLWPEDADEAAAIRNALAACPNLWTHLERIPTEPALNDLMGACDVLAAAYTDFPHSSGIQAKAAVLGKPLIVSGGYLMAERAKRFRMGEIVPQQDAGALLDAVVRIARDPAGWADASKPLWREYLQEHSFERLKTRLADLLAPF
ncbi:MAG: glycosyltransferase [Luteolibacter sp.]|jgi:glycosyltransferase involved in cell wall biosynthesis|nr:glycosyltransferase [Luteolibacter sp.]